jgi:predicted amidohydrolase YtcJ
VDALALLTGGAAIRDRAELWRGTLAVGQRADLAVLEGEWPSDEDVESLLDRRILRTLIDGETVYTA